MALNQAAPKLQKMVNNLHKGDIVVVWKLDSLGHTLKHLVELVAYLSNKMLGLGVCMTILILQYHKDAQFLIYLHF